MRRLPPCATRTATLFPYPTRVRAGRLLAGQRRRGGVEAARQAGRAQVAHEPEPVAIAHRQRLDIDDGKREADALEQIAHRGKVDLWMQPGDRPRSEERRVGKECVSTCRSRG